MPSATRRWKSCRKRGSRPSTSVTTRCKVGGHQAEGVHVQAVTTGGDGEDVEDELGDGRIEAEEHVAAQGAAGEELGGAGDDLAGLAHGRQALPLGVPQAEAKDFNHLVDRERWRQPPSPPATANHGQVA